MGMNPDPLFECASARHVAGMLGQERLVADAQKGVGMWQRLNESAREAILLAQNQAVDANSSYVGTDHLLLGLLAGEESAALAALDKLGATVRHCWRPCLQPPPSLRKRVRPTRS